MWAVRQGDAASESAIRAIDTFRRTVEISRHSHRGDEFVEAVAEALKVSE